MQKISFRIPSPKLSPDELDELFALEYPILQNKNVQKMADYKQHGTTSTLTHVMKVARASYKLNKKFHLKADEKTLVTAALLHDFYLYDWHDKNHEKLHGFKHPERARRNAEKYLRADPKIQSAIATHMWPLTITKIPRTREAFILTITDKYCTITEVFKRK